MKQRSCWLVLELCLRPAIMDDVECVRPLGLTEPLTFIDESVLVNDSVSKPDMCLFKLILQKYKSIFYWKIKCPRVLPSQLRLVGELRCRLGGCWSSEAFRGILSYVWVDPEQVGRLTYEAVAVYWVERFRGAWFAYQKFYLGHFVCLCACPPLQWVVFFFLVVVYSIVCQVVRLRLIDDSRWTNI